MLTVLSRLLKNQLLVALVALCPLTIVSAVAQDYTVNLKEADIQELIKFVAEATDTTIVVDPAVKGKVKVVSSKPVSRSELYNLFLSILEVHGYTAIRSGGIVRVIQSKDARSSPVTVRENGGNSGSDEYVTEVIRLEKPICQLAPDRKVPTTARASLVVSPRMVRPVLMSAEAKMTSGPPFSTRVICLLINPAITAPAPAPPNKKP